jgi:hypothetical protein
MQGHGNEPPDPELCNPNRARCYKDAYDTYQRDCMLYRISLERDVRNDETKGSSVISLSSKFCWGLCRVPLIRAIWSGANKRRAWDDPVNRGRPPSRSIRVDSTKSGRSNLDRAVSRRATVVGCAVLLASQLLAPGLTSGSARGYYWLRIKPVMLLDPRTLLDSQEPNGGLKMNHNPESVRLFRVTGARIVNPNIVIEYVERGEFKDVAGGCGKGATFLAEVLGTAGANECTFTAVAALRRQGLYGTAAELPPGVSRSIDEAVEQMADYSEARMRERTEFQERWTREHPIDNLGERKQPAVLTEPQSLGKGSDPVIIAQHRQVTPEEGRRIDEQVKQQVREVWSYGRGKRLEWKRIDRTPAGRDCEVLTVDGEELLYPGPASIETSPPKPR